MKKQTKYNLLKYLALFIIGWLVYSNLEVFASALTGNIARSYGGSYFALKGITSLWMGPIGGAIFVIIGLLDESKAMKRCPVLIVSIISGIVITSIEFGTGYILNHKLGLGIWDYRGLPLAKYFYNQINLFHFFLWILISPFAFWLDNTVRYYLNLIIGYREFPMQLNLISYYRAFFTFRSA